MVLTEVNHSANRCILVYFRVFYLFNSNTYQLFRPVAIHAFSVGSFFVTDFTFMGKMDIFVKSEIIKLRCGSVRLAI